MKSKVDSVMAALSVRSPTVLCRWISVFLLLILTQMLSSPVLSNGVFILSNGTLIGPSHFCLIRPHGELICNQWYRNPASGGMTVIKNEILTRVVILCLYIPVVLVAFALLVILLAAYAKHRAAFWFSVACQAASSLLILTAIIVFLQLNQLYVSWEHMTLWFYTCVGVQIQLVIVTALTCVSGRRLTSDWEYMDERASSPC